MLILAYNMVITPIRYTINVYSIEALGNKGNISLRIPYKLSFKTIFLLAFFLKLNLLKLNVLKVEKFNLRK